MKTCPHYLLVIICAVFCSCTYNNKGSMSGSKSLSPTDTCSVNISYNKHITAIMNTYCAIPGGCHTGGASWGDYTGFAGVKQKAQQASNNIMTRLNQGSMPPTYSTGPKTLSKCELSKIESWINDGCQNN